MIKKIKAWPIGGKIAGGIVGGIIGLFLLLSVIAFFNGMIRGIVNGPQKAASANTEDYYSFMNTMIPHLDADCTTLANDMNQIESGDNSQSTFNKMEDDRQTVTQEISVIKAYGGKVPSQYQTVNDMITNSMNELQSAVSQLGIDALEFHQSGDSSTFGSDAAKFNEAKRSYTGAYQIMQKLNGNQN